MKPYLDQLRQIIKEGVCKEDRTGVGTLSCFGMTARYRMADGFPAVTTKQLAFKTMASELLWFISGSGNLGDLKAIYPQNRIWDANHADYLRRLGLAENDGDMGRIYGVQWRRWRTADGREIDQLQGAIDQLRANPSSRRILVNAWNPGEVASKDVALPPCHTLFQFHAADGALSLLAYQRSADMFLGTPFNIASYALLLHLVARLTGLRPHEFIHSIGDAHLYLDALPQAKAQLRRRPHPLPELRIADRAQATIDDFRLADLALANYRHHPPLRAQMAV